MTTLKILIAEGYTYEHETRYFVFHFCNIDLILFFTR
ncbi:MAG: hypothetical protein MHPDNHAH_00008 [Anaerolineales bacterium]|nr:hypothetical protein [Anaerolineales bacterium]